MPKVACERRRAGEISSPPLLHVRLNARMYAAISTRGRHRSHCEFDCLLHAWASTQGTVNRQLGDAGTARQMQSGHWRRSRRRRWCWNEAPPCHARAWIACRCAIRGRAAPFSRPCVALTQRSPPLLVGADVHHALPERVGGLHCVDEMANVKRFIERQPFGGTSYVGIPMWENERGVREVCKHAIPNQGHDLICNATQSASPLESVCGYINFFRPLAFFKELMQYQARFGIVHKMVEKRTASHAHEVRLRWSSRLPRKERPTGAECVCARGASRHRLLWNAPWPSPGRVWFPIKDRKARRTQQTTPASRGGRPLLSATFQSFFVEDASAHRSCQPLTPWTRQQTEPLEERATHLAMNKSNPRPPRGSMNRRNWRAMMELITFGLPQAIPRARRSRSFSTHLRIPRQKQDERSRPASS